MDRPAVIAFVSACRALLAGFVVVLAVGMAAASAHAAFPGTNGKIAFVSNRDGNYEIYVMNADGTGPDQPHEQRRPSTSIPPGPRRHQDRLRERPGRQREIYVMNADGTGQTGSRTTRCPTNEPPGPPTAPRSPSSYRPRPATYEIYAMNADGTGRPTSRTTRRSTSVPPGRPTAPRSPSRATATATYEIYVMNADGTGQTQPHEQRGIST